jgi:hypothetical protein
MKAKLILGFLVVVLGTALGVASLDGDPIPLCRRGVPCQVGNNCCIPYSWGGRKAKRFCDPMKDNLSIAEQPDLNRTA